MIQLLSKVFTGIPKNGAILLVFNALFLGHPLYYVLTCPRKRRLTKNAKVIIEKAPNMNIITKSADFPLKLPSSNILQYL